MNHIESANGQSRVVLSTRLRLATISLFIAVLPGSIVSLPQTQDQIGSLESRQQKVVSQMAVDAATFVFKPSLEMKENVDFLLTPALLVQNSLSNGLVVTYPSE